MKRVSEFLIVSAVCLAGASALGAQAPPGPMTPPPGTVQPGPPTPKKPEIAPRKDILGAWRFNKDDSDDPRQKAQQSRDADDSRRGGGYGGPRIGFPGPGGGGPYGGRRTPQGEDEEGRLGTLINPVRELQLLRRNENDPIEMLDDHGRRHIFYTDGRKIEKQKDPSLEEISARWDGNRLVTDEKGPHNGKISRIFELSEGGRQLLESVHVTDSKGKHPLTVNYVYDAVEASSLSFPTR